MGRQKGCIGLFKESKVRIDGQQLIIVNPDRTWVLEPDKGTAKKPGPSLERWAARIEKFAKASSNKGYESEDAAAEGGDAADTAAAAAPRRWGFDEDAAEKTEAAKGRELEVIIIIVRGDLMFKC